jgi:hypothetical protein
LPAFSTLHHTTTCCSYRLQLPADSLSQAAGASAAAAGLHQGSNLTNEHFYSSLSDAAISCSYQLTQVKLQLPADKLPLLVFLLLVLLRNVAAIRG